MTHLDVFAPDGIGEIVAGTDLAAVVAEHVGERRADVVIVVDDEDGAAHGQTRSSPAPQCSPAPRATKQTSAPGPMRPLRRHSSKQIGSVAAVVFP